MRLLLACTCLTPVTLYAGAVHAERTVDTKITTPIATSTASNNAPDNIKITSAGSVVVGGGAAVTVDSNNSVVNDGTIQVTGAGNSTGILANPGAAGNITNTGRIILEEDYAPTDTDKDGDIDGPFAQGSNRFGIRVAPGGTFTSSINNASSISIEGNDSAGIAIDSRLVGSLTNSGSINVIGDRSVGVRAGEVTGNVQLRGAIAVQGANSVGVALDGNIGGALSIQGTVTSTGYRSLTVPADTSKLDADDLLQGGPAVRIAGNVAGGIIFARPPADANKDDADEDDDGIPDASEGTANVASYGAAPAVQIGGANDIAIGAVAGAENGHGLVIDGAITGAGLYKGVDGNALVIGGAGGDVSIAGGMTVRGTVRASSADQDATAIRIASGSSVPEIRNSGSISTAGATASGTLSQAILIESGANVSAVRNSGEIVSTSGADGGTGAIIDRSGNVSLIENSGKISASGATAASGRNVAIDLAANNGGAIVRQTTVGQGVTSPTITGDILFGAGDDLLDVADGAVTGSTRFGAGANRLQLAGDAAYSGSTVFGAGADRVTLGGTSTYAGSTDFGGGADVLELTGTASFRSQLANTAGLSVNAQGGLFEATNLGTVALSSLNLGADAAIGVNIDAAAGTNTLYDVAGPATIANGADVRVRLANVSESEGRYVFLRSANLTGAGGLNLTDNSLPFLFKGTVDSATAGEVAVVVSRRSATELGFNGSETRAYDAVFAALDSDKSIANSFLSLTNGEGVRSTIRQMLPDHAGGAFDAVTQGSRATARFLADPHAPLADMGGWGFWLQQIAWGSSKDLDDTAAYDIAGWGTSAGAEVPVGNIGRFGASIAYLNGEDSDGETDNEVRTEQYELAAYWRGQWGGFNAWARASAAMVDFSGTRFFTGNDGSADFTRTATGDWNGQLYSAAAGVSYELGFGRFNLRPLVSVDYYRLSEDGYTEQGGGDAFNLTVDDRTSDEFALNATLTAGYEFGRREAGAGWLRTELEAGRRQILGGSLGTTTARFKDGEAFTLLPEERTDGWVGRLRIVGGQGPFSLGGEASAEEQLGRAAVAFRVSLRMGM